MSPQRVIKSLFFLLYLTAVILFAPQCAMAATYKLPVRTATLVVSSDYYGQFVNGEPVGHYEFYIDPPVLKVGRDATTNLIYESLLILDLQEYAAIPNDSLINESVYLVTSSAPAGVVDYLSIQVPIIDRAIPQVSDFDLFSWLPWDANYSPDVWQVNKTLHNTCGPYPLQMYSGQNYGYVGWQLTQSLSGDLFGHIPIEIAGINNPYGMEDPHILVTTVPEPSSLVCFGIAALLMGRMRIRTRNTNLCRLMFMVILAICTMSSAFADLDSEPGECTGFSLLAGPSLPPTSAFPSGYTYLPAFPRFLWSFGCAPTTGAMIVGYYDNAGFPRMYRNQDDSDALCPTGCYP